MSQSLTEKIHAFDSSLPLERARTIPSLWYFDPGFYAAECQAVFATTWQQVGRLDQLPEAGSFFTTDSAGEPIVVLRDGDQVLRAFVNVCRHRAARVAHEPCGKVTRLRCRYHGWTYDLTGRLRGTPEFDGVADFCREDQGLVPLAVQTWGPLVWIRPGGLAGSLAEFLAPLPERTTHLGIEDLHFFERREYTLACNWKVFVDNYLDGGYHVNTIHPGLAGVLDYSHYRTEIAAHASVQSSPLRAPNATSDDLSASQVRTGDMAYYWWVFPNFMVNIYQGMMDTNLVLPLGPERCRVIFDFFFADQGPTGSEAYRKESVAVAHQIQLEDQGICEDVQKGLASRFFDTGRFSVRREIAGYHFHCLLARSLAQSRSVPGNESAPGLGD